jgi:hypothetical protein
MFTYEIECATGGMGEIGKLYINAYDETTMTPIDFNITFFDSNWGNSYSETYCHTSCTCPCDDCTDSWNVSFDVLPQGTDCYMIIGNGSYHDRYFRMDIYDEFISFEGETYYTLCLDVILAPETARLYTLKVVDDYYHPLEDVEISIKKYIDPSIGVVNISTLRTDSYGTAQVYLISLYPYMFNCSKSGYNDVDFVWIPPNADNVTKTIKMSINETVPVDYDSFWDNIVFTGVMTSPGYPHLGNITITYFDRNSSTTNTQIYLYESYNGTITLLNTSSRTGENSFSYTNGSINTTRLHYATLYFNNTASFEITSPVTIAIYPLHTYTEGVTPIDIDDRITPIVGPPPIGTYANIIAVIVPLLVLVSFGPYNTGIGLLGCGASIGFMQGIYAIWFTNSFNVLLASLCPLVIVISIIYFMTKGTGGDHL